MKKNLLILVSILFPAILLGQSVIQSYDFSGGSGGWTLNPASGSGSNKWIVNNTYASSQITFFPNTPAQPAAISNPGGKYLHVYETTFPVNSASADNTNDTKNYAEMSTDISTVGYTGVSFLFYYICDGVAGLDTGSVEYSTNGGGVWTQLGGPISGQATWSATPMTFTNAAFDNQATLRFRFCWSNYSQAGFPHALPFAVDDVSITGTPGATISTSSVTPTSFCSGDAIAVPFTMTGSFFAGNSFTVELSTVAGSFPGSIIPGSLSGTTAGTVNATIPLGTPSGNLYRVRVHGSSPIVTAGTNNGANLIITAIPNISISATSTTICGGSNTTLNPIGAAGFSWAPAGVSPTAPFVASPATTTIYTCTGNTNGCLDTDTITINVNSVVVNANANPSTICAGDIVTLCGSGNGCCYSWMPSPQLGTCVTVSPGTTTTYTTTAVLGSCAGTATATVTVNLVNAAAITSSSTICSGTCATLTGSGGTSGYAWMPGSLTGASVSVCPVTPTTFTVTATSGTCTDTASVFVDVLASPISILDPFIPGTICVYGAPIGQPAANPAGGTFGGDAYAACAGNQFFPNIALIGTHYLTYSITGANTCVGVDSSTIIVDGCVGMDDVSSELILAAYPNPANGSVTLEFSNLPAGAKHYEVINILGQVVKTGSISTSGVFQKKISLDKGIYFVRIPEIPAQTLKIIMD